MTTVGPYELSELLGSGGMGAVYQARHVDSGRVVALKLAKDSAFAMQTVRNEARALARLHHPGIVGLIDCDLQAERPWLAMELIRGRPLSCLLYQPRPEHPGTVRHLAPGNQDEHATVATSTATASESGRPHGSSGSHASSDDTGLADTSLAATAVAAAPDAGPWWTTRLMALDDTDPTTLRARVDARGSDRSIERLSERSLRRDFELSVTPAQLETTLRDSLDTLIELCHALAYLHGEGLVHCDLKPENIVLRDSGQPVLVDFGLVCPPPGSDSREVLTQERLEACTPYYIAPERIQQKDWDARADLYALGCILFEIATGLPPFTGGRLTVMDKHVRQVPRRFIVGQGHGAAGAFADLVAELLHKDPCARVPYAEDVARRLCAIRASQASAAEPASDIRSEPAFQPRPAAPAGRSPGYLYRPRFAGRPRLIEELEQLLSRREPREREVVLVAGESGSGKTRLLNELVRLYQRKRDRLLLLCECAPPTADERRVGGGALHPFREFSAELVARCRARESLAATVGVHARVLSAVLPELALLCGDEHLPLPILAPDAARERLLEALTATLTAYRGERPMLLILDDLQWADDLTLELCARIAGSRDSSDWRDVMLVGAYRSEEAGGRLRELIERHQPRRVALTALDRDAITGMVADILAVGAPGELPADLVDFVLRHAGGNPFFLTEYMLVARQRGWLIRDHGTWRFSGPEDRHELPERVHDLILSRSSSLPEGARRLLELLAVLGRETGYEELALCGAALGIDWQAHLGDLLAAQILEERPDGVRFQHDQLREVGYRSLDAHQRRALHGVAARSLESLHQDGRGSASHRVLAHHFQAAGQPERALEHLDAAALQALRSGAEREAYGLLEQALDLSAELSSDARMAERRGRWHRQLAELCYALGELEESRGHVDQAMRLLYRALPRSAMGWALSCTRETFVHLWHRLARRTRRHRARDSGNQLVECSLSMRAYTQTSYYSRPPLEVFTSMLMAVNLAERSGEHVDVASNYAVIGYVLGLLGWRKTASRYFAHAHDIGREYRDHSDYLLAITTHALHHLSRAEWQRTEDLVHELTRLAESARDQHNLGMAKTFLGHTAYYRGEFKISVTRFAELRALARKRNSEQHQAWGLYGMARGLIALGRFAHAIEYAERARGLLEHSFDESSRIICRGLLATAYLRAGDTEAARRCARETQAMMRGVPMVFSTLEAMAGVIEVHLCHFAERRAAGQSARDVGQEIARELGRLRRFSKRFQFAVPQTLLLQGETQRLVHRAPERARRCFREAAIRAEDLGMAYPLALANLALARGGLLPAGLAGEPAGAYLADPAEAAAARERAIALFSDMGCEYHLELLDPQLALGTSSESDPWSMSLSGRVLAERARSTSDRSTAD